MTKLQQLNTLFKEYIKIPLNIFYERFIMLFSALLLIVLFLTSMSIFKLISLVLIFTLLLITSLLYFGDNQEETISQDIEKIQTYEIKEEFPKINESKKEPLEESSKDFIA